MIQAFAPRYPRGFFWLMLTILAWGVGGAASAQSDPAKQASPPPQAEAKPGDSAEKKGSDDNDQDEVERFVDPNAKRTLAIFKPIPYAGMKINTLRSPTDMTRVQNMAGRVENTDPNLIKNYVEYFATELSRRDNINALIAPPANLAPTKARGLEQAVDALTRPIIDGRANNNTAFLTEYTKSLFDSSLPKLLDNNYFTRIDAMIVLGMAGATSSTGLDFYASQLKVPDQVIWVKMWAARGYTNAAQSGHVNLDAFRSLTAADALVNVLNGDPKPPSIAQFRFLEALGSLRVATVNRPDLKVDVASTVAQILVDPAATLETRAWAAWALGMMRVAQQVSPYNFPLAGYEIGGLTVDLGNQIVAEYDEHAANFDRDKDEASNLTALLMFQVIPSIAGEEGVSDSGLLRSNHPNAANARSFLGKLDEKIKAVSREAYELLRKESANQKEKRNDLAAKVADLKTFLEQNKPKDRHLVPDGPTLSIAADGQ